MRMEMHFEGVDTDSAFDCVADINIRKKWDHRIDCYNVIDECDDWIL
jgi:hypothetical protein